MGGLKPKASLLAVLCAVQLATASPAQATALLMANSELLGMFQVLSNQCLTFTYDLNGNRLTSGTQSYSTAPTWGTSVYGCFGWS